MTRGVFHPRDRLIKVILNRVGTEVDVLQPDSPPENKYGKVGDNDYTYTVAATEEAYRTYGSYEERPREDMVPGGEADMDTPRIIMWDDTVATEGDRVEFSDDSKVYELDKRVPRETHVEFRATLIT